jgi:hypothetical protein
MTAVLFLLAFIAICLLAACFGTDSRFDRPGRQL